MQSSLLQLGRLGELFKATQRPATPQAFMISGTTPTHAPANTCQSQWHSKNFPTRGSSSIFLPTICKYHDQFLAVESKYYKEQHKRKTFYLQEMMRKQDVCVCAVPCKSNSNGPVFPSDPDH